MSKHERPVFVDDSGVRRFLFRALWLGLLGVVALSLVSGVLDAMFGKPLPVDALTSTSDRSPYEAPADAIALPPATPTTTCTTVTGEVFIDWDLNGWRTASTGVETGVEGIDVVAYDETGTAIAATTTGVDGRFRLDLSVPRHVRIEFSSSIAAFIESPVGKWTGTATQFPVAPKCTADLGITWKRTALSAADAAARRTVAQASGHVWLDADCDGVLDPGEAGVLTEVLLRDADTGQEYARTSTTMGAFVFGGLEPGVSYEVVIPDVVTTHTGRPQVSRGPMDGAMVVYSGKVQGARASFVLDELGQSRHGLRFPIAPAQGCTARPS